MNAIAAVDANWAIGSQNRLLLSIPQDMKFFRETTKGKVVVMGRKTLESFPGGNPLKNRVNIVLTANRGYAKEGVTVVHDLAELSAALEPFDTEDVFVIGGGSIYSLLLPMCSRAYITRIEKTFEADTWFPNLDQMDEWEITARSARFVHEGIGYSFVTYEKTTCWKDRRCTETIPDRSE